METGKISSMDVFMLRAGAMMTEQKDSQPEPSVLDFSQFFSGNVQKLQSQQPIQNNQKNTERTQSGMSSEKTASSGNTGLAKNPVKEVGEKVSATTDSGSKMVEQPASEGMNRPGTEKALEEVEDVNAAGVLEIGSESEVGPEIRVDTGKNPVLQTEQLPEEVAEAINALIINTVATVLNITPEECAAELEQLKLEPGDLLSTDGLKDYLLTRSGQKDPIAFLMDESLRQNLDILTEAFQTIEPEDLASFGIDISKEELEQSLLKLSTDDKTPIDDAKSENVMQTVQYEPQVQESSKEGKVAADHLSDEPNQTVSVQVEKEEGTKQDLSEQQMGQSEDSEENSETAKSETGQVKSEHTAVSQTDTVVQSFEQVRVGVMDGQAVAAEQIVEYRQIVNQLVETIKVVIRPDTTQMSMQLNPEQLGRVTLQMTAKNGQMTASFIVQNEMAKEAIESNMAVLRENLSNQGLKVEAVEVTISDFSLSDKGEESTLGQEQGQEQQSQNSSKGQRRQLRLDELMENEDELSEQEQEAVERMKATGATVDFIA